MPVQIAARALCHLKLSRDARQRILEQRALGMPEAQHPQEHRDSFGQVAETATPLDQQQAPELPPLAGTVVVVTGLPRTGTSMMMQMLAGGGMPVLADEHRPADASNERGYFEHQAAKRLAKDAAWVADAKGQAVKLVAQLIPRLPRNQRYRVIMMHRPLEEVIASQGKMLARLSKDGGRMTDEALQKTFASQVAQVRTVLMSLRKQGLLDILDVKYHDAIGDPSGVAGRVSAFLGDDFNADAAARAVDPNLRHECVECPAT